MPSPFQEMWGMMGPITHSLHTFLLEQRSGSAMAYKGARAIASTLNLVGCPAKYDSWALHHRPGNGLRQGGELWCHLPFCFVTTFLQATPSL